MHAIVLAVPITMHVPAVGARRAFTASISAASMRPPRKSLHRRRQSVHAPSVSPRWWPTSIGPTGTKIAGRSADAAAIICAGNRLVAAADQHHGVHRLGADHLLGVHRHQVAQEHAGRVRERLVDRDRRELHRQPAREHHAALDRVDELRHVAVAGVVVAEGVGDADDRPRERVVREAHRLDEGLAQEERELGVAVRRQPLLHALLMRFIIRWRLRDSERRRVGRAPGRSQARPRPLGAISALLTLGSAAVPLRVRAQANPSAPSKTLGILTLASTLRMRSASGCPGCAPS